MFISLILCRINTIFIAVYSVKTDKLPLIFKQIVQNSQEKECQLRPQLLSIFKEILANHIFYDAIRNKKIYDTLYEIVMNDITKQSEDNLSFTIDLFTALLHNLGSFASENELKDILDRILIFYDPNSSQDKQNQLRYDQCP